MKDKNPELVSMEDIHSTFQRIAEYYGLHRLLKDYGGCQQCGWCCKNERLTIFKEDVQRLGSFLKSEHIHHYNDVGVSLNLPCPFLKKSRCSVYSRRSDVCKTYPFLFHYPGYFTVGIDCPTGKKLSADIIIFCNSRGIKVVGDEGKTREMQKIDQMVEDQQLNSGNDNFSSKILNISFEMFDDFLTWRKKRNNKK